MRRDFLRGLSINSHLVLSIAYRVMSGLKDFGKKELVKENFFMILVKDDKGNFIKERLMW